MRTCLFSWLETLFNENIQVKQRSVTTGFNGSSLNSEFIYNNTPYGVVPLGLINITNKPRGDGRLVFYEPLS